MILAVFAATAFAHAPSMFPAVKGPGGRPCLDLWAVMMGLCILSWFPSVGSDIRVHVQLRYSFFFSANFSSGRQKHSHLLHSHVLFNSPGIS